VLVLERDENALIRQQGYRININLAGDAALRQCLPPAHYALYQQTSHRQLDPSVGIFTPDLKPVMQRVADVPTGGLPPAAVDRATLRAILLDAAQNVRFSAQVVNAIETEATVEVELGDGSKLTCGLLIAADGASSALRRKILPGNDPQPLRTIALYGKAALDTGRLTWLPSGVIQQRFVGVTDNAGITLALGAWYPRRDPAEAAQELSPGLALPGTTPYVMCVLLVQAEDAPTPAASPRELHEFMATSIRDWHPAATQFVLNADVAATFRITLRAVSSVPEWAAGRITFLGDAIHAMSPAGGEGANTSMADAASLASAFEQNGIQGIATYEADMRQRARMALQRSMNYGRTNNGEPKPCPPR
jgi:2-polyprenyl-6-methoxyphenol hydroxylase-like FAD-dependent oxidoreductase